MAVAKSFEDAELRITGAMRRLKAYYPFRIVWGAINPETFEIQTGANATRRQVNDYVRKGWRGFTL